MKHCDLQGQRRDMKNKGRNVVWSSAMDKCLIEALVIQAKSGNRIEKCFNENAYTAACIAVNTCFNLNLNNQKVINRLKTLKKRYRVIKDILSQDGFRWNPDTKMIECDHDELWKRYVMAHPNAKGFRGKQIEMYEQLKIVCGNYRTANRWAKMKNGNGQVVDIKNYEDESASFASRSSENMSDTDGTESYNGPPEYGQIPDGYDEPPVVPPLRQPLKRSRSSDELQDALMTVASSFHRLADSIEQIPDGYDEPPVVPPLRQPPKRSRSSDKLQDALMTVASSFQRLTDSIEHSKCSVDTSELLQAVMEIDGLEESKQMYAFEYLNADPIKARAFLTYNTRMRKIYLFRQFWWWS